MKQEIIILLATFVIIFVCMEYLIRRFNLLPYDIPLQSPYTEGGDAGHVFKPNYQGCMKSSDNIRTCIKTNSFGQWEENNITKSDVLVLGDSYTFGAYGCQYNETYPKKLGEYLNKTVINAGVPGYTVKNEIELLKQLNMIYQPKSVYLTFYIGNDITDRNNYPPYYVENGNLVNKRKNDTVKGLRKATRWLSHHSLIYKKFMEIVVPVVLPSMAKENQVMEFYENESVYKYKEEIRLIEQDFLEFKSYCYNNSKDCSVVIIPSVFQILSESNDKFWVQRHFIQYLQNINQTYIDTTDMMLDKTYYLKHNNHWTKEGCEQVANIIAEQ